MNLSLTQRQQIDAEQRADQQRENDARAEMKTEPALLALIDRLKAVRKEASGGKQRIPAGPATQAIQWKPRRRQFRDQPDTEGSIASVEAIDAIEAVRMTQQRHASHTFG